MIVAAKCYDDPNRHHLQTDNPSDEMLRKSVKGPYLESCGPTAMTNCIDAMGIDISYIGPALYIPQPEEIAMDFFHDPRNRDKLNIVRESTPAQEWMGNRVPQFYPVAAMDVFGVRAVFKWGAGFDSIINDLREGKTVQICLKTPGHYVAVVGYDDRTDELIYHDSWPRKSHRSKGFMERFERGDMLNFKPYRIVYQGE